MRWASTRHRGFTIVELLIACTVMAIIATLAIVSYQNAQKRAAHAAVRKDLKSAAEQLGLSYVKSPSSFSSLDEIAGDMQTSGDVILQLITGYTGPHYDNLSPVQNGVLFHSICVELVDDPYYSEIHAHDGTQTNTVVTDCNTSINDDSMLINGWDSEEWKTPVTRQDIQNYINNVPYDSYWSDKQDVVRAFYTQMVQRFEARGGTFPITSFWEPDAGEWWGIPKEELPEPSPPPASLNGAFCVEAYHASFPDDIFRITQTDKIEVGSC